jgi:hypothetical protein
MRKHGALTVIFFVFVDALAIICPNANLCALLAFSRHAIAHFRMRIESVMRFELFAVETSLHELTRLDMV